jgi:hypothetical protein
MVIQRKKAVLSLLAFMLMFSILMVGKPNLSLAASAPTYTVSYYMNNVDTSIHYDIGYKIGQNHLSRSGTQDELIILDYGAQNEAGTGLTLRHNPDATYDEVRAAAVQVARGYWLGAGEDTSSTLRIVIGTNNSGWQVDFNGGKAFSEMINNIYADIQTYSSQSYIYGGNDMEIDYATASDTRNWADGYDSVNKRLYYNYGDAAGCTTDTTFDGSTDLSCTASKNTWKMSDIFYVSWGVSPALVVPQIYFDSMAKQWKNIKKYGVVSEGRGMNIHGSLTQEGACEGSTSSECTGTLSPSQGWTELYNQLNSDTDTSQGLNYSTDIKWY